MDTFLQVVWEKETPDSIMILGVVDRKPLFTSEINYEGATVLLEALVAITKQDHEAIEELEYYDEAEYDIVNMVGKYFPFEEAVNLCLSLSFVMQLMRTHDENAEEQYADRYVLRTDPETGKVIAEAEAYGDKPQMK